jgi:O-antigen/teichoic acid export membrane protein
LLERLQWLTEAKTATAAVANTIVTRGSALVLNIGTGVICARSLGAQGRGEQAAMGLWPGLLGALLTLGLPAALRYFIPKERAASADLLSAATLYGVFIGCVGGVVGALCLPLWMSHYSHGVVLSAQILLVTLPGFLLSFVMQGFLEARGEFGKANLMFSLPAVSTLTILVVLLLTHRISPLSATLAYMVPSLAITAWRVFEFRNYFRFPASLLDRSSGRLFSYGLRVYGVDIIGTLSTQIDQALVVKFLSSDNLGLYAVALAASRVITIFQSSVTVVLFPKASSLEPEDAVKLVIRASRLSLLAIGTAAALAAAVIPFVLPLLYGHTFAAAVPVAQVLVAEAAISGTTFALCQSFLSTGRPLIVTSLQGIGLASVIPLMLVFIPRFGLIGAAFALLFSTLLRLVVILACYPIFLRQRIPSLIPTLEDIRFVTSRLSSSS